jgi:hypothetical protein
MIVEECRGTNYPSVFSVVGIGGISQHFVCMFLENIIQMPKGEYLL